MIVQDRAELTLPEWRLEQLLSRVQVEVSLGPGSGLNVASDWWTAGLDALAIGVAGLGIDTTLDALTAAVRAEIDGRIDEGPSQSTVALLLRLWLADRRGQLRDLLETSAVVDEMSFSPDIGRDLATAAPCPSGAVADLLTT